MKKIILIAAALGLGLLFARYAASETLLYQARIQTAAGEDINGPITLDFNLYPSATATGPLWSETQSLTADRGIVNVELGKVHPLYANLHRWPELYLGIAVAGDEEMTPRRRLITDWKAASANRVGGKMVQAGGGTLTVAGAAEAAVALTFPKTFYQKPVVMVGAPREDIDGISFVSARVTEVTTTGCTVHFLSLDGAAATGSAEFDWIAIGE